MLGIELQQTRVYREAEGELKVVLRQLNRQVGNRPPAKVNRYWLVLTT